MSVPPLHPPFPLSLLLSLNCTLVHLRSSKSQGGGGRGVGLIFMSISALAYAANLKATRAISELVCEADTQLEREIER